MSSTRQITVCRKEFICLARRARSGGVVAGPIGLEDYRAGDWIVKDEQGVVQVFMDTDLRERFRRIVVLEL